MLPKNRTPTHPGEILREDFLEPLGTTQVAFAAHLDIPLQRVNEIIRGKRGISAATAWLFAGALGTTPQFWTNLQSQYDLAHERPARAVRRLPKTG
ncbi:MAG: HigA family addiction module antidote protein [Planctomycetes bacterium]|nr:HigA family addiction module antidote protein [Planctomycetota bacterium]